MIVLLDVPIPHPASGACRRMRFRHGSRRTSRSGSQVGWTAHLHFFIDDIFPKSIGRPIL